MGVGNDVISCSHAPTCQRSLTEVCEKNKKNEEIKAYWYCYVDTYFNHYYDLGLNFKRLCLHEEFKGTSFRNSFLCL